MEEKEIALEALIALLSEQTAVLNEKHASIWRCLEFTSASTGALLAITLLLIDLDVSRCFITLFPLISLLICIAGLLILHRESQLFLKAVYATSVLHNEIGKIANINEDDLKKYGIDELQCNERDSAKEYVEDFNFCWAFKNGRINARIIIYYIISIFALLSAVLMAYLIIDC